MFEQSVLPRLFRQVPLLTTGMQRLSWTAMPSTPVVATSLTPCDMTKIAKVDKEGQPRKNTVLDKIIALHSSSPTRHFIMQSFHVTLHI